MAKRRTRKKDYVYHIAYKYRGYPDSAQENQLSRILGCVRWLYNRMLSDKNLCYKQCGESLHLTPAWYKHLSNARWLKECDSLALANTQLNLEGAMNSFFAGKADKPQFKKKSSHRDSYTTNVVGDNIKYRISGKNLYLRLPKFSSEIKLRYHRRIASGGTLKSITVSREPNGSYYFSMLFEFIKDKHIHEIDPSNAVGLDMTMSGLCFPSEGQPIDTPKFYRDLQERIAIEQRRLSHMKKGSSNYRKQRKRIASLHAKAKRQRSDMLHKISRKLVDQYDIIGIEDLNMRGMSQALNFGKSVMDKGWGMFTRMLDYKADHVQKKVIRVGKFYPSSQTCHECGCISGITKDLNVREWTCPHCGHTHLRDLNAALNIRDEAVRLYCTQ